MGDEPAIRQWADVLGGKTAEKVSIAKAEALAAKGENESVVDHLDNAIRRIGTPTPSTQAFVDALEALADTHR